jgi:hypothetical protein
MDIDGDGNLDVLSGSNPGEIYLFRGNADHSFAAGEMLKDKKGAIINKSPEDSSQRATQIIGSAVAVSAADWDGDGVVDLIVGNGSGDVYLIRNEGTAQAYAFGEPQHLTTTNGKPVKVSGRGGPCVADWDGDGDLDLLVGGEDGSVQLYRNIGTKTAPRLALPLQLVTPGTRGNRDEVIKEARRATRSKICVADWNGDGKPDLLLGDLISQKAEQHEPTAEEKAKQDQARKDLEPLMKQYTDLASKMRGNSSAQSKEERDKVVAELMELRDKIMSLQAQLPRAYETHGWVWLFLRK